MKSFRKPWLRWLALVLAVLGALAIAGAGYVLFFKDDARPRVGRPHESPRTRFQFADPSIKLTAVAGKPTAASVRKQAEEIRSQLSAFYDAAFLEPETWQNGLPDDIWTGFTKGAAAKAAADAGALTLGRQPRLVTLEVESSSLVLHVLLDGKKRPTAIVARAMVHAAGSLADHSTVDVASDAEFLFRPVSGRWMVAGFPAAKVRIDSAAPSPEPSATAGSAEPSR